MELKVTTLDGKEAGSVELPDAIFGLEPRADILHRCVRWQLAKRQRRHAQDVKNRAEINRTGKKMYRQKGTGSARHGSAARQPVPRRRPLVRADAAQPRDRPAEEGARARAQARAVGQGQGRRHHRARQGDGEGRQDQGAWQKNFSKLGLDQRADHRRRRGRGEFRAPPRATSRTSTCCRCRASTSTTSCGATSSC